ncbi:hypothetical protein [Pararhodobacter zhoushanensis]|uniref:Uncharacterized protein n=1 Tax=Pararhodobacter zhoushanensis TaxID=2479545 RepID=A0ABT3GXQ9_9RHOB|nr:hypothetical protein [Pararhodobacter zhoushanensis]MCW1932302.1 hypothetical protein [Pararhodobacter zhoushanensis]
MIPYMQMEAADRIRKSRPLSLYYLRAAWNAAQFAAIGLEFMAVHSTVVWFLRDPVSGELPPGSGPIIFLGSAFFCVVTLAFFHKPIGAVRNWRGGSFLLGLFALAAGVTFINALIPYLNQATAGSWDDSTAATTQAMLRDKALMTRAMVIVMGACVASNGLHGLVETKDAIAEAIQARNDGTALHGEVLAFDELHYSIQLQREMDEEAKQQDAQDVARGISEGLHDAARRKDAYLMGGRPAYPSREQLEERYADQSNPPFMPADPALAELVRSRVAQHSVPLALLPPDPNDLDPVDRAGLSAHAAWLRTVADRDAIYRKLVTA